MNAYWIQAVRLSQPPCNRVGYNSPGRVYRKHSERGVKKFKKNVTSTARVGTSTSTVLVLALRTGDRLITSRGAASQLGINAYRYVWVWGTYRYVQVRTGTYGYGVPTVTVPFPEGRDWGRHLPMPCSSIAPSAAYSSHNCKLP